MRWNPMILWATVKMDIVEFDAFAYCLRNSLEENSFGSYRVLYPIYYSFETWWYDLDL